jgi:hypothetical protein
MKRFLLSIAIISTVTLAGLLSVAQAQGDKFKGKIELVSDDNPKPKLPRRKFKPVETAVVSKETASTGSLSVRAEAGAKITLELIDSQSEKDNLEGQVPSGKSLFIFNELKPGRYRVSVELEGYRDAEGKDEREVEIKRRQNEPLEFDLREVSYDVTIITNVTSGEFRYAAKGQQQVFTRNFREGKIILPLHAGTYEIEIRPTEFVYEPLKKEIEIGPGKVKYNAELIRRPSPGVLAANWTTRRAVDEVWDMPQGWSFNQGALVVNGKGIALPKDETYRSYADLEMVCDVKLNNGIAASFVLRAEDEKNYYLVQITGASADEPHVLRGYVVKDGAPRRLQSSISISGFASSTTGVPFELSIKFIGNKIGVSITDSTTGRLIPLGELTDFNSTFSIGAAGIAVRDNEQFEIGRFVIQPAAKATQ